MQLIDSMSELRSNLNTLETYRNSPEAIERRFYNDLISRGRCFVVYERDKKTHFAPSRFVGYKNNNRNSHQSNREKDGKETNPIIDRIVGRKCEQSEATEKQYQEFCDELNVRPWRSKKKFWKV